MTMTMQLVQDPITSEDIEAQEYRPGTPVEFKHEPGKIYIVEEYDPMMVPPVWLVNEPMPRYPHELKRLVNLFCPLPLPQAA
jgi:hypothetical protein